MCHDADSHPPELPADLRPAPMAGGALETRDLVLTAPDGNRLRAFEARAPHPTGGGVVIFPDWRGLGQFYEELAMRFAEAGYDAVAFDYFGRTAGTDPHPVDFDQMPHLAKTTPEGIAADAAAAAAVERFVRKALRQMGVEMDQVADLPGVWDVKFSQRFAIEFPKIAKDGPTRRVTFEPSVALDMETVEFLAFGNELVDGLVARARSRDFGGRAGTRCLKTAEIEPTDGWFFTYELEFEGVVRSKELMPVFVERSGEPRPDVAAWLLERAMQLTWEEPPPGLALPTDGIETALAIADRAAATRLFERQAELAELNRGRLEQERAKLTRYYEYRERSAGAKLASTARTLERIKSSDNPDEIRILPVWVKNLEIAQRTVDALTTDRDRRLRELDARDQVAVQQQMMTGAYVLVTAAEPDQPEASS